jgi:hypothetical protein
MSLDATNHDALRLAIKNVLFTSPIGGSIAAFEATTDRILALVAKAPAPTLPSPLEDYLTPCPWGHATVIGWLAEHRPELIATLGDAAGCTQRDGFWLAHRCRERGIAEVWVRAPKVMQDQGIDRIRAYPVRLVEERFQH